MTTRVEEIAKADAEVVAAVRDISAAWRANGCHRLADALKARTALDQPPKPKLRTPEQFARDVFEENTEPYRLAEVLVLSRIIERYRHEIAELVRTEFARFHRSHGREHGGTAYRAHQIDALGASILSALEGR